MYSFIVHFFQVIVVTVAYRLNILGFFTTTDAESPGNFGMLDQVASLDWVKKNIEFFDGASSNIVIWGHSSGAISVGLHLLSPLSRGKFAKAIAMSGDAIGSVRTPQQESPVVDQIVDKFGCYKHSAALMECLRRADAAILVRESSDIETWGPIIDSQTNNASEPFLPMHPKEMLKNDNYYPVPLMVGFTNNEQALAYIEAIGSEFIDGKIPMRKFESMIADEALAAVTSPDENSTCELRPDLVSESLLFMYKPHPPSNDQGVLRDRFLDMQTDKNYAAGLVELATKLAQ